MSTTRRSFLGGIIALTAYSLAPKIVRAPEILLRPRIWADGIHDDSPGLNALFNDLPVDIDDVHDIVKATGKITGGSFLLRMPIVPLISKPIVIHGSHFIASEDFPEDEAMFDLTKIKSGRLDRTHMRDVTIFA